MKGSFISIEGPDGSGKTTNIQFLAELFRKEGYEVVVTREPGGSPLSEKIRTLIIEEDMCSMTELLLLGAARAQHIHETIKPALRAGKIVLCDRFCDSTYAYQGAGRGLTEDVLTLEDLAQDGFEPDVTLFFDISLEESERRLTARAAAGGESNRFDTETRELKKRIHAGFGMRYVTKPHRMHRIDAGRSLEEVQAELRVWFWEFLSKPKRVHHLTVVGKTNQSTLNKQA